MKQNELDNLAKNIISGTVQDKHVMKIIKCTTTREMWNALERMCARSEEIKQNKLSIACQKFDNFQMLKNELIEEMEFRFHQILNEVQAISRNKYTQHEINLKIIRSLTRVDWQMYAIAQQTKPNFNILSTVRLFSDLKANEFDIQRNKDSKKAGTSDDDALLASKGAALKAASRDSKKQSKESTDTKTEDFFSQYALMTEWFNKMESRFRKYKKFHKKNFKGKENEYKPRYSNDKSKEKKSSTPDLKAVECFGCGKEGHYKTDCPEISYLERKALRAKRDEKYEKKKVMVAEDVKDFNSSTESSSSNSTSSDDESQALMAKDAESVPDNNFNSYDNGLDGPEIREKEISQAQAEKKKNSGHFLDETGLDELIVENNGLRKEIETLQLEKSKLQSLLEETETDLKRTTKELDEDTFKAVRLNDNMEQWVKNYMKNSPLMKHFPSSTLVESVGEKLTAAEKGKWIETVEITEESDDEASVKSKSFVEEEDKKRKMMSHKNIPSPEDYRRPKVRYWKEQKVVTNNQSHQ
ncbi:uncharacterized protein LOC131018811 [Salvia miltiorrhiza]|uniref:uncharacterized protein LOC131018811 n=1 Tax=Salvia miltiorrhiza TaxID=226208 RepID=UPI0025AB7B88|nr:uncharacterized protein LOC131018811 [Salvia miltiorrhiza]